MSYNGIYLCCHLKQNKHNFRVKVKFQEEIYQLVFTDHAEARMNLSRVSPEDVKTILETGKVKFKDKPNSFWVYKSMRGRKDNVIYLSVSIENPFLIVITSLVNWRPL